MGGRKSTVDIQKSHDSMKIFILMNLNTKLSDTMSMFKYVTTWNSRYVCSKFNAPRAYLITHAICHARVLILNT